jgi:nucleoside-diphosphate kinase
MAMERTLGIAKPDTLEKNHLGEVLTMIERAGLTIRGLRLLHLTQAQAEGFYEVHRERPFFGELVEFMTRGPVAVFVLEGDDAISRYRKLMGATDPAKAEDGTIRKAFGANIGENACHGSDSPETARFEVSYFFPGADLVG